MDVGKLFYLTVLILDLSVNVPYTCIAESFAA